MVQRTKRERLDEDGGGWKDKHIAMTKRVAKQVEGIAYYMGISETELIRRMIDDRLDFYLDVAKKLKEEGDDFLG